MPVTININNLTLCHKGSNGVSKATLPDMCKTPTPGGPQPMPYPNVAMSSDLAKGTTTVTADGGNMCASYGSEFSKSMGDEGGTLGGVKSGTFMKEATWITFSLDVKMEGKATCRLTDKMFHNHQNTVNASGLDQMTLEAMMKVICEHFCDINKTKAKKGGKFTSELMDRLKKDKRLLNQGLKYEGRFLVRNVAGKAATALGRKAVRETAYHRLKSMAAKKLLTLPAKAIPVIGWLSAAYDVYEVVTIIPDLVQMGSGSAVERVLEVKFDGDDWGKGQKELYQELDPKKRPPVEINSKTCKC